MLQEDGLGNNKIKELEGKLEESLEKTQEVLEKVEKMERYLKWFKIWSVLKILFIIVPIVLGFIYLPPILEDLFSSYRELLAP